MRWIVSSCLSVANLLLLLLDYDLVWCVFIYAFYIGCSCFSGWILIILILVRFEFWYCLVCWVYVVGLLIVYLLALLL